MTRREVSNFIREAMKSAAITNEALAQNLNVIRNTVQLWFKKDDITISNIYKIAEGYGWEVNITFKLKKGLTLSSCVKPEQRTSKWDVKFEKWTYITFLI